MRSRATRARSRPREDAVARGLDRELDPLGRWFLYLPFEHAEDAAMQRRSLELFGALSAEMGDPAALEWAQKHADVIFRFGRYPHRNAILGRASSAEESGLPRANRVHDSDDRLACTPPGRLRNARETATWTGGSADTAD